MRKLTTAEIDRASDPRFSTYTPAAKSQSVPPGTSVARSVHLDGEYVLVDRTSYSKVCARLGVAERSV